MILQLNCSHGLLLLLLYSNKLAGSLLQVIRVYFTNKKANVLGLSSRLV